MKKRFLCKLGFHVWYDAMEITNEDGFFSIRKCKKCDDVKVYRVYFSNDYTRFSSHLLKREEIPKSVKREYEKYFKDGE